jgi:peroxiredoxin
MAERRLPPPAAHGHPDIDGSCARLGNAMMEQQAQWEAGFGLRAGDLAPEFRLRDAQGGWISLAGVLGAGPAVLLFVGAACARAAGPTGFRDLEAQAAAQGATLLVISPGAEVSGLQDPDSAVGRRYGAPEGFGVATYVIDRDGRIVLSCVEPERATQPELSEAMAALKAMRARGARG